MAKTNYSKAEEAFAETMQSINRKKLLAEADAAKGKLPQLSEIELQERKRIIKTLNIELKRLHKEDPAAYKTLKIKKKLLSKVSENVSTASLEEWGEILEYKKSLQVYLKERKNKNPDDKIVEEQRKKHINKRFNINDKWLPLK